MAFCPECGKSAAAEASKCIHCGHDLGGAKAGGARFKGTMMMSPQAAATPAATSAAAPPIVAPPPAAAAAAAPKPMLKATMLGAGIVPPVAGDAKKMAFAATQPAQAAVAPQSQPQPDAEPQPLETREDSSADHKYLPGDPMAPHPSAGKPHAPPHGRATHPDAARAQNTKLLLIIAIVGMAAIGGVGMFVAMQMGLYP